VVLPRWRRILAPVALGVAAIAVVGTYLVQESGPALEEHVEDAGRRSELLEEHTEMGEDLLPFVIGFLVLAGAATAVVLAKGDGADRYKAAVVPLAVLTLLAGAASTVQVVRIGHSGAKAAWDDTVNSAHPGQPANTPTGRTDRDDDD
jgi:hypothetical protein